MFWIRQDLKGAEKHFLKMFFFSFSFKCISMGGSLLCSFFGLFFFLSLRLLFKVSVLGQWGGILKSGRFQ